MESPLLQAKQITKSFYYPQEIGILKGIDLSVTRGETVAIMGRSGEGKSTLLQILGTLDAPCSGKLEICGEQVNTFNKSRIRNQKLAFIFQSFHLLDDYTALENVLMPARIGRKKIAKGSEVYERGMFLLERVALDHRAHFNTKLLSGGEKQRVAIARAMCNNPELILADEPSGNLDKQTSEIIHSFLIDFVKQDQKGLIVVTHDRDLAALCEKNYLLSEGILNPQITG